MSPEQLAAPPIRRQGDRASVTPGRFRGPLFYSTLAHLVDKASINVKAFWFICTLAAIESLWAYAAGLKIAQGSETLLLLLLPIAAGLLLDAFRVAKRCSLAANFLALWLTWLLLGSLLSYLAASLNFSLYDATFARIDESLGFNWVKWFQFVASYPVLNSLLTAAYMSMFPQIIFAIVFLSRPDRAMYGEELWWTTMIAVIITCVISGLLPAMCAWSYYQMSEESNIHIPDLMAIRDGTMCSAASDPERNYHLSLVSRRHSRPSDLPVSKNKAATPNRHSAELLDAGFSPDARRALLGGCSRWHRRRGIFDRVFWIDSQQTRPAFQRTRCKELVDSLPPTRRRRPRLSAPAAQEHISAGASSPGTSSLDAASERTAEQIAFRVFRTALRLLWAGC